MESYVHRPVIRIPGVGVHGQVGSSTMGFYTDSQHESVQPYVSLARSIVLLCPQIFKPCIIMETTRRNAGVPWSASGNV